MKVFDKEFEVALLSKEDKSNGSSIDRRVVFTTNGEVYHYEYGGSKNMCLSSVYVEDRENEGKLKQVYSSWRHIEGGSYFEEIGRRLSIDKREAP